MFTSHDLKEMGRKCAEIRIKAGITQKQMAENTNTSRQNISAFETGRNDSARLLLAYQALEG